MSVEAYYTLNFSLMQYHKYSLTEIENMIPWERDVYVALLQNHLEEEKLKQMVEYLIYNKYVNNKTITDEEFININVYKKN